MRRLGALTATLAVLVLITGACAAEDDELTPINLQLQWVAQAQFAGYYAAVDQGFYADEGLDVTILEGAVEIVPQQVVATGGAEFGLAWVPKALVSNEEDAGLVNVGQVFQRSGTATNPATGELYQPSDLTVIDFNDPSIATAMLQDAIWVTEAYAEDNADTVEAFLRASFRGWIYCRDNPDSCVDIVLAAGPTLGRSHQTWQMNEINGLIWPSPLGIGVMDGALWQQTVDVATSQGVIQGVPPAGSYRTDFAQNAVDALEDDGLDTVGNSWQRVTVELNPGGE